MPKSRNNTDKILIKLTEYSFFIVIALLTLINLSYYSKSDKVLGSKTEITSNPDDKIIYLENLINENPMFFDAYVELTKIHIEKNDIEGSKKYFEILKTINPNSQITKGLEKDMDKLN